MPTISIIVPVYKVEALLPRCVDSILCQSFDDFELILVDDGSPDRCGEICDAYAQADRRVRVIHQKNSGVGAARNRGLQTARGTFTTYIDSDDQVAPGYLENLLRQIGDQDILIAGFSMCKADIREKIGTVTGAPSVENLAVALKEGLLNSCWAKLYRTAAFRGIRFSEQILWGEDTAYLMCCLCKTRKVVFDCSHDYWYTFSMNGLANRFDQKKPMYLLVYYEQLILFLRTWAQEGDRLYRETAIKISQEMLRTVDALTEKRLCPREEKEYLRILFSDPVVNRLFARGVKIDQNPTILKQLAKSPNAAVWRGYLLIRRLVLKGKR